MTSITAKNCHTHTHKALVTIDPCIRHYGKTMEKNSQISLTMVIDYDEWNFPKSVI